MRLGFFVSGAFWAAGCAAPPAELARRADADRGTAVFSWLLGHTPATLAVSGASPRFVGSMLGGATVFDPGAHPCASAKRRHAAWLLVAPRTAHAARDGAENCGYALFRDAGALVIAPW